MSLTYLAGQIGRSEKRCLSPCVALFAIRRLAMKGIIKRAAAAACLGGGLSLTWGCAGYRDLVDPCWPTRYDAMAAASVNDAFAAQVNNGHVLDQTVWNYHF